MMILEEPPAQQQKDLFESLRPPVFRKGADCSAMFSSKCIKGLKEAFSGTLFPLSAGGVDS